MLVVLDTTVLIDYLRGYPAAGRVDALAQADALIAAAAVVNGAKLATGNIKHFPMTELDVEFWEAGC